MRYPRLFRVLICQIYHILGIGLWVELGFKYWFTDVGLALNIEFGPRLKFKVWLVQDIDRGAIACLRCRSKS